MAMSVFSAFKYADILVVVVISAFIAFIEGIACLLIYRTLAYNSVRSSIDNASKKSSSSASKKMEGVETIILVFGLILTVVLAVLSNFKSDIVIAVIQAVVFRFLNYLMDGGSVAKVPPVPKMTHRGLTGIATDCSMTFLYLLCSITIRLNLWRFLCSLVSMPDAKTCPP